MAFELLSSNNQEVSRFIYNEHTNKATFWVPTRSDLENITDFLFNANTTIFEDIGQKLFNADPQRAIMSVKLYPLNFAYIVNAVGTKNFSLMGSYIPSTASPYLVNYLNTNHLTKYINFGYIDIPYYEGTDSYLSYEPYTKLFLYLPFAPLTPLDTRRVAGKRVRVRGVIDLYEGAMIYYIEVYEDDTWVFLQNVSCTIAVDIPIYKSNDYDVRKSVTKDLLTGLSTMALGGAGGGVAGFTKGFTQTANKLLNVEFERSPLQQGNFNNLTGFFQPLKVNLITYTPNIKYHLNDTDYNHLYGVPCKKIDKLNTFGGFTKVGGIHIKEMQGATTDEIKLIEQLLLEGVILDNTSAIFDVAYDYDNTQVALSNTLDKVMFGGTYTTAITILSGYQVDSIKVYMGGQDITSTAVSGNVITITNVSGNISIKIVSSAIPVYYTITYTGLTGANLSNTSVSILQGTTYETDITPDYSNGYLMGEYVPTVTMGGAAVATGVSGNNIRITNVQGNLIISGTYPQVTTMTDKWVRRGNALTLPDEPIDLSNVTLSFDDGNAQYSGDDIVIDNQLDLNGYFISFSNQNHNYGISLTGAIYEDDVYKSMLDNIQFSESSSYYTSYSGLLEWLDENFVRGL